MMRTLRYYVLKQRAAQQISRAIGDRLVMSDFTQDEKGSASMDTWRPLEYLL